MTTRALRLAKGLTLPLETVTQKFAWLGVTGSGKTYGASKLAELMWHAGAQFLVLDPVGVWYGLRLAKGGRTPSALTVPIFGGLHSDVPLEPTAGALIANLVVDKTLSAIIDVSQFESDADKARFARDFADRFFFRKKAAPSAVHLFIEECQEFVPQNPQKGEERMLHAFVRMQKLGRNFGIGSSYVSQRPQEVNKKALNLAQTLFVFRTTGSHERAAIEKWIEDKALDQDIAGDLPKIETGDCHVWSPEFLKISETVHILEKETFNASATPEVGVKATTRELAPIDLERVRSDMAATIEKAKADDPRELRKQIADLKKELAAKHPPAPAAAKEKRVEVLTDADRAKLTELVTVLTALRKDVAEVEDHGIDRLKDKIADLVNAAHAAEQLALRTKADFAVERLERAGFQKILDKLSAVTPPPPHTPPTMSAARPSPHGRPVVPRETTARRTPVVPASSNGQGAALSKMHRAMLTALAQHPDGLTKRQILVHTTYASSGPVSTAFADLARESWVAPDGNRLRITDAGYTALGSYDPLPVGDELRAWLLSGDKLSGMEKALLTQICDAYPEAIRKGDVLEKAQYASSGPVSSAFAKLVAYNYAIPQGASMLKAAEELFS
jgi:uncharacterized protein DUF87